LSWLIVVLGRGKETYCTATINRLVKAFNITIFIRVYKVERRSADEFMRLVTCPYY